MGKLPFMIIKSFNGLIGRSEVVPIYEKASIRHTDSRAEGVKPYYILYQVLTIDEVDLLRARYNMKEVCRNVHGCGWEMEGQPFKTFVESNRKNISNYKGNGGPA